MSAPASLDERRTPMQRGGAHPDGSIAWAEHLECYVKYAARYGKDQSAERLAERGGFGYDEFVVLMGAPPRTWRAGAAG